MPFFPPNLAPQKAPETVPARLALQNSSSGPKDSFWYQPKINAARWSLSYPYQLLVVEQDGKNSSKYERYSTDGKKFSYVFPLPPQSFRISMPFASDVFATLGGIAEENGGAPFRLISAQGTTGVFPLRGSADTLPGINSAEVIFGGTINKARGVADSARDLVSDVTGKGRFAKNLVDFSVDTDTERGTGYYQFHLLQRFFEDYAAVKKTARGRNLRLAFCAWKDQAVYLVTPVTFDVERAVPDVWEYRHTVVFRAWKRINLDGSPKSVDPYRPKKRDKPAFTKVLSAVGDLRDIVQKSVGVVAALGDDVSRNLFGLVRELGMLCKEVLGVPFALSDISKSALNSVKGPLLDYFSVKKAGETLFSGDAWAEEGEDFARLVDEIGGLAANDGVVKNEDPPITVVFDLGGSRPQERRVASLAVAENPERYYSLLNKIPLRQLDASRETLSQVAAEAETLAEKGRAEFEEMRDQVLAVSADLAASVGLSHPLFESTYGREATSTKKKASVDDVLLLGALNTLAAALDALAATTASDPPRPSPTEFFAGLASGAGIAYRTPRSKFAVPFPYGSTMEQLAVTYLGDPDRWVEIASLNGLRSPYVDEEGFDLPLTTHGSGNEVVVADAKDLYLGQSVWVTGRTTRRTKRRIVRIDEISSGQVMIGLDGDADLALYKTSDGAALHANLPDTVNSTMLLWIPSDAESSVSDFRTKEVPTIDTLDRLLATGGTDLLLDSTNDLALTPDGDGKIVQGLACAIQTAKVRIQIPKGGLLHHPEIGLSLQPGVSTADLDSQGLFEAARDLFSDDPSFTGVGSASAVKDGPTARLFLAVGLAGVDGLVPVGFEARL